MEFESKRAEEIADNAMVGTLTEIEVWLRMYHDAMRGYFAAMRLQEDADEDDIARSEDAMERELWVFGLNPVLAKSVTVVREPFREVADTIRNERDVYRLLGMGHKEREQNQ